MAKQNPEYNLNEPMREIPGGPTRRSVHVSREGLGAVAERERIEQILCVHDLDGTPVRLSLKEQDGPILRMIARETIASSLQPAVRAKAIAALAQFPSVENLNTVSELAAIGDDVYVRSHALMALGSTGLLAVVPTIANSLQSKETLERNAAGKALLLLADKVGLGMVETLIPEKRGRKYLHALSEDVRKARARRKDNRRSSSKSRTQPAK